MVYYQNRVDENGDFQPLNANLHISKTVSIRTMVTMLESDGLTNLLNLHLLGYSFSWLSNGHRRLTVNYINFRQQTSSGKSR